MDLSGYLRFHRVQESAWMAALDEVVADIPDGALALAGSLIEGIGNERSDIDVYLVAASPDDGRLSFGDAHVVAVGGLVVDIEYVDPARLRRLTDTLARFPSAEVRNQRPSAVALTLAEIKILHNLRVARPVKGEDAWRATVRAIDARGLARLIFDFCAVSIDMTQEDAVGFLEAEDPESAVALLRMLRQHLAGALLAAFGETNPAEKWRSLKLRRLAQTHGALRLPGGRSVSGTVAFLRDADVAIGLESPARMLTELLQLAHAVLPWGLARFESGVALNGEALDGVPVDAVAEPVVTDADAKTPPLPALTHDTRIRRDAEGIWISRIGSARRIYINAIGHELLLHFDGRTQAGRAASYISAVAGLDREETDRCFRQFATVLSHERMIEQGAPP